MAGFATPPRKSLESPEVIATGEAITEDVVGGMDFALQSLDRNDARVKIAIHMYTPPPWDYIGRLKCS